MLIEIPGAVRGVPTLTRAHGTGNPCRFACRRPQPLSYDEPMAQDTALIEATAPVAPQADAPLVEEEMLIEEISIDGMCGVY